MACGFRLPAFGMFRRKNTWPTIVCRAIIIYFVFAACANWKNPFVCHLPLLKLIYCVHNYSREASLLYTLPSFILRQQFIAANSLAERLRGRKRPALTHPCAAHMVEFFCNFMFYLVHFPLPRHTPLPPSWANNSQAILSGFISVFFFAVCVYAALAFFDYWFSFIWLHIYTFLVFTFYLPSSVRLLTLFALRFACTTKFRTCLVPCRIWGVLELYFKFERYLGIFW